MTLDPTDTPAPERDAAAHSVPQSTADAPSETPSETLSNETPPESGAASDSTPDSTPDSTDSTEAAPKVSKTDKPDKPANPDQVLFTDLALPKPILSALAQDGYVEPSPIQAAIIPFLLDGRDVIGQAQTGTGKTAAFALPILAQLADDAAQGTPRGKGPTTLVLAPTRELAIQVADAFANYARNLKQIRVLSVYGGADFRGQALPLQRGVDIVVGTPGRIMDHMRRGTLNVKNIRTLVLDEADEMLRMGFVDDVEWVLSETPPGRQVALFSATMPREIQKIAEKQLQNPQRIQIKGGSKTADTVRQRYWRAQGATKFDALCRLLAHEPVDTAIVFVRTRAATAELARGLEDAGFPAAALSGDVAQNQRERTIDALRNGRLKLVVATDVAARGLDVKSITHVFNYDVPVDTEAYIHRIGRTGRAGRTGNAILFVENRQRHLLKNIERATGHPIEKMDLPSPQDIHALQLDRFADKFKERLKRKPDEPAGLRSFIETICEETGRDPLDVAAFLVGPAMRATTGGSDSPASAPARPTTRSDRPERSDRFNRDRSPRPERDRPRDHARPAGRNPMGGRSETYRVAVGRTDGVHAGHLVGAIANETGLDGQDIGGIRIFDSHSTVELPAGMPKDMFEILQRTTVLGKPLRIRSNDHRGESHGPPVKRPHRTPAHTPKPSHHSPRTASPPAPAFDDKPRFKAKFAPKKKVPRDAQGKPKFASPSTSSPAPKGKSKFKPAGKNKGSFKPAGSGSASGSTQAKPFKKAKFKPAGKPGSGVKSKHGENSHSLAPAPFAGGKGKPKRYNKRPKA